MQPVYLTAPYITKTDINEVVKAYKQLLINSHSFTEIKIVAKPNVVIEDVDLLLISCLILIKVEFPHILISIEFPYNDPTSRNDIRLVNKLTQSAVYGYLMTNMEIFTLRSGDVIHQLGFKSQPTFREDAFLLSDSFMLFLYVTKDDDLLLYERLFINNQPKSIGRHLEETLAKTSWDKSVNKLHQSLDDLIVGSSIPSNRSECISNLGLLAFINCLSKAYILPIYVRREVFKENQAELIDLQVSALSSHEENNTRIYDNYEYYKKVEEIFLELETKPLIYHFVFSALVSQLLPGSMNHSNKADFPEKVFSLWEFCEDLVHGLTELAKNIRDHSSEHRGIISANLIKKQLLGETEMGKDQKVVPSDVLLNLHVLDFGKEGIMRRIHNNTEKLIKLPDIDDDVKSLLEKDLIGIVNEVFNLESFFSDKTDTLHQQAKRSIAHFGLLILKELINSNKGAMHVSSIGMNGNIEVANNSSNFIATQSYIPLQWGTHFDIVMPIGADKTYHPHLPRTMQMVATESELQSIENLLNFNIVNLPILEKDKPLINKQTIFSFEFPDLLMNERESEKLLREEYRRVLQMIPGNITSGVLLHLNFDNIDGLDATELFRFLGYIESRTSSSHIIVSHIDNSVFEDLLKINKAYYKILPVLGFWNKNMPTLFLTYEVERDTSRRFYFTDVLWGETAADFFSLNKVINFTQFNSVSLMDKIIYSEINDTLISNDPSINTPLFINNNVLLPVDLLIKHKGNESIYENNVSFLLSAELL